MVLCILYKILSRTKYKEKMKISWFFKGMENLLLVCPVGEIFCCRVSVYLSRISYNSPLCKLEVCFCCKFRLPFCLWLIFSPQQAIRKSWAKGFVHHQQSLLKSGSDLDMQWDRILALSLWHIWNVFWVSYLDSLQNKLYMISLIGKANVPSYHIVADRRARFYTFQLFCGRNNGPTDGGKEKTLCRVKIICD